MLKTHIMRHIFWTARPTNFKLGVWMEDDDSHQPQAPWLQRSRSQSHMISLSRLGPMLYLCHQRLAGAYRVGRTWRPCFLLLYCYYFIIICKAHSVSNETESEVSAVSRWAELVRVLMNYLKRWVYGQCLRVSLMAEGLILRANPFHFYQIHSHSNVSRRAGTDPCTTSGSALFRCSDARRSSHTHRTGPSRFFCCCSIHLELSTCWHSTVRKHSHFQTPLENPSIQTHLVLLCWSSASVSSDLKALYKSVIIIIIIIIIVEHWGKVDYDITQNGH